MVYLSRVVTSYICYLCQCQEKFKASLTYIYVEIFHILCQGSNEFDIYIYIYMSRFYLFYVKVIRLLDFMSMLTKSSFIITPSNVKVRGHICHGNLSQ